MSPIAPRTITLRSILFYICVGIGIFGFIAYALFQARFILEGPEIFLTSTTSPSQSQRLITLQGTAKNIVRISLDGRQIYTDKYGNFKEALVLENGYTIATLQAEDIYGRTIKHTEKFVYTGNDQSDAQIIN